MNDAFPPRPLASDALAELIAAVPTPGFADLLLDYLRKSAVIASYGTFYVPDLAHPVPVLTVWGGEMSGYWFNRNAQRILSNDALIQSILERIRAAGQGGLSIERWRPAPSDPLAPIYHRDAVIERVTVSSHKGRVGFQSFFLRSKTAGWLTKEEMRRLETVLPLVHELLSLRHRIIGSTALHQTTQTRVTALRERNSGSFGKLSPREAKVCDLLLQGLSVTGTALQLGVSENTVRTFRRRAYEKLGVHSATQIAALILNDKP